MTLGLEIRRCLLTCFDGPDGETQPPNDLEGLKTLRTVKDASSSLHAVYCTMHCALNVTARHTETKASQHAWRQLPLYVFPVLYLHSCPVRVMHGMWKAGEAEIRWYLSYGLTAF
jgi:hypothetical protein